jgi:hypothetical protein
LAENVNLVSIVAKQAKDVKEVDFEKEDNEEVIFVECKNKKLIQKRPYDRSDYGYMLVDHLMQNVCEKRIYRHFYVCDKNGGFGRLFISCSLI